MLVSSKICERMFGQTDVLLAAHQLTELPGIFTEPGYGEVEYFHLVFDRHEVIYAEGAPTESFFPGPEAIKSMPRAARTLCHFPAAEKLDRRAATGVSDPSGQIATQARGAPPQTQPTAALNMT